MNWIFSLITIRLCVIYASNYFSESPKAPALADSDWPIAHGSTWNSDVTNLVGPDENQLNVQFFINGDYLKDLKSILETADPITLVQTSDEGILWGSSITSVFQLKTDEISGISLINSFYRDFDFSYHGAYCLLANDGTFYAASKISIQAYNNEIPFDYSSSIVLKDEYFVLDLDESEHIVGLTITYDSFEKATLLYATTKGKIGGISLDFSTATNTFQLPGLGKVELPYHFISNSIAFDGIDGIFAVTSLSVNKLYIRDNVISLAWSTDYSQGNDTWFQGRLGPGIGTSPSIMGPSGIPEYIVNTDGNNPMNILFHDATTGELVGSHVVTFGSKSSNPNSTTDQSITVHGYKAVVVNNWVDDVVPEICTQVIDNLDFISDGIKHECPFLFGAYVNGIEQFEINPLTNEVSSVWSNSHVSCTSSIPVLSSENVLYCLGKRKPLVKGRAYYTIEAIDWNTGKSLYYATLPSNLLVNSLYAATEIGTTNDIVMGSLGGILRISGTSLSNQLNNKLEKCSSIYNDDSNCISITYFNNSLSIHEIQNKLHNLWQAFDHIIELQEYNEIPDYNFLKDHGLVE